MGLFSDWYPTFPAKGSLFSYDPLPGSGRGLFGGMIPAQAEDGAVQEMSPLIRLTANTQTADAAPASMPPFGAVPDETKRSVREDVDNGLAAGAPGFSAAQPLSRLMRRFSVPALISGALGNVLKNPATRQPVTDIVSDGIIRDIQGDLDRASNQYGQQTFINSGGWVPFGFPR